MGSTTIVENVTVSFDHLSDAQFAELRHFILEAADPEEDWSEVTDIVFIDDEAKTVELGGASETGSELVGAVLPILSRYLPVDSRSFYVHTRGMSSEPSWVPEDNEAVRFLVGPGECREERLYVLPPHFSVDLLVPNSPWTSPEMHERLIQAAEMRILASNIAVGRPPWRKNEGERAEGG